MKLETTLPPRDERSWIQTFTGKQVFPLNPQADDIDIEDIAHALSMICRYTGHTRVFYSVAQHATLMTWVCNKTGYTLAERRAALLHDASEAYLCDVARPIKPYLGDYRDFEDNLTKVIFDKFGVPYPLPPVIKQLDLVMLATERRDLLATPPIPWVSTENITPLDFEIIPWPPRTAKEFFLSTFRDLWGAQ